MLSNTKKDEIGHEKPDPTAEILHKASTIIEGVETYLEHATTFLGNKAHILAEKLGNVGSGIKAGLAIVEVGKSDNPIQETAHQASLIAGGVMGTELGISAGTIPCAATGPFYPVCIGASGMLGTVLMDAAIEKSWETSNASTSCKATKKGADTTTLSLKMPHSDFAAIAYESKLLYNNTSQALTQLDRKIAPTDHHSELGSSSGMQLVARIAPQEIQQKTHERIERLERAMFAPPSLCKDSDTRYRREHSSGSNFGRLLVPPPSHHSDDGHSLFGGRSNRRSGAYDEFVSFARKMRR